MATVVNPSPAPVVPPAPPVKPAKGKKKSAKKKASPPPVPVVPPVVVTTTTPTTPVTPATPARSDEMFRTVCRWATLVICVSLCVVALYKFWTWPSATDPKKSPAQVADEREQKITDLTKEKDGLVKEKGDMTKRIEALEKQVAKTPTPAPSAISAIAQAVKEVAKATSPAPPVAGQAMPSQEQVTQDLLEMNALIGVAGSKDEPREQRLEAIKALGKFHTYACANFLRAIVTGERDPALRHVAALALGEAGNASFLAVLKQVAENDSDPQVKEAAMKSAERIQGQNPLSTHKGFRAM